MAKIQTYSEEQLLDAVMKYADEHAGKIQVTELAEWAAKKIPGLEGVRYYNFTRPMKMLDPKTGKKIEKKKLCKQRIDEINKVRSVAYGVKTNVLLQSAQTDDFFKLPVQMQRKMILDTRSQVDSLMRKNLQLTQTNKRLMAENKILQEVNNDNANTYKELKEKQTLLAQKIDALISRYGEETMRSALEQMGVTHNGYDLKTYSESLSLRPEDVFSVSSAIKKSKQDVENTLAEDIMKGLDF